ncbi:hypothetical protein [Clostridium sp. 001]|uniref:hypothetical protein n=1 Tax=Clostridium sp. 001 TaxID=1970093 RepID=UPI001C2BAAB7|nr:hypothetical protein [Clostridium sp. 001]
MIKISLKHISILYITIVNLIGFYYGRLPQKMQQDIVLQHSRMYGYRSREDFEQGKFEKGVIFISKDEKGRIIPCSPEKIKISNTHVLKTGKTTTPVEF